jgi:hypothetical protein
MPNNVHPYENEYLAALAGIEPDPSGQLIWLGTSLDYARRFKRPRQEVELVLDAIKEVKSRQQGAAPSEPEEPDESQES